MTKALFPASITRGLKTSFIGRRILYYPTLTSTMDKAREMAPEGAKEGTVIMAGEQTRGRGRLKRKWFSPPGNIALSIILYPNIMFLPYLIMVASLAVVHAIEKVAKIKAEIKWPNDIMIGRKKVCGILVENDVRGKEVVFSVVGIGLNVDLNTGAYPEIADTAASLKSDTVKDLGIKLIRVLLTEFERLYIKLPDEKEVFDPWREKLTTLGKRVRATSGNEVIEGTAEFVDRSGALFIRQPDGSQTKVVAGDVTLR